MRIAITRLGLIAVSLAIPCSAEEVVTFKSGQSMPIVSHTIEDGMVHVDLGDNALVAFPVSLIDSIVVAGKNVMIKQSYGTGSNRRTPTTQGSYPVTGHEQRPKRDFIAEENTEPSPIEIDEQTGMAIYRPMGNSSAINKRRVGVTGNMRVLADNPVEQGDGVLTFGATTPMGNRHVIGSIGPRRDNAARRPDMPKAVSVRPKNINDGPVERPDAGKEGNP